MKKIMFFIILLIFLTPFTTYANSGPVYTSPVPGFQPVPLKSDSVEVLREDLTFDTKQTKYDTGEYYPEIACITAKYQLFNTSDKTVSYSIAFPHLGSEMIYFENGKYLNTSVKLNGKDINCKVKVIPDITLEKLQASDFSKISFDSILKSMKSAVNEKDFKLPTDSEMEGKSNYYENMVRLILFDIDLAPKTTYNLEVSFYQESGISKLKTYEYTYRYDYFLEPARYWKAFKNLNISVKLPQTYEITSSSLKFKKVNSENEYTAHFDKLPDKNLQFDIYKSMNIFGKFMDKYNLIAHSNPIFYLILLLIVPLTLIFVIFFVLYFTGIYILNKAMKTNIKRYRTSIILSIISLGNFIACYVIYLIISIISHFIFHTQSLIYIVIGMSILTIIIEYYFVFQKFNLRVIPRLLVTVVAFIALFIPFLLYS
ncbi:MAG: hypothetical protein Q8920_08460 [Bacillota bacterium]|nr:hypothetical protein [Bacillota bacterium]